VSVRSKGRARVYNRTKGTLLASRAEIADSVVTRLVGLLGRRALFEGQGMWLVPSNSIHTIGVRFPIDVVMLSRNYTVVGVRESVGPFSVVWPNFHAKSILELPADTIAKTRTEPGDLLQIEIGEP
jgi:uncharacterized protein